MPRNKSEFRTTSTISCCRYCIPPKRHTACWGHCPEYLKEKAEYEKLKEVHYKKKKVNMELYAQKSAAVKRARKGGK